MILLTFPSRPQDDFSSSKHHIFTLQNQSKAGRDIRDLSLFLLSSFPSLFYFLSPSPLPFLSFPLSLPVSLTLSLSLPSRPSFFPDFLFLSLLPSSSLSLPLSVMLFPSPLSLTRRYIFQRNNSPKISPYISWART